MCAVRIQDTKAWPWILLGIILAGIVGFVLVTQPYLGRLFHPN
jgi:uncharacterized membrane protein HdeD (DUF308 family)